MANNPYVRKPGTGNTAGAANTTGANMAAGNTANAANTANVTQQAAPYTHPVKEKKYRLLNAAIIIMTIILFFMIVGLVVSTSPRTENYYDANSADDLIRKMNYSGYQRLVEGKYENEVLGYTADKNESFVVPYAIADYYEAAFNYRGYAGAGDPGAADYKAAMDKARESMGEYAYIADDIDEYLGVD